MGARMAPPLSAEPLRGLVAVVTGSSAGGIGAATAQLLASAGADIVLNDRIQGTTAGVERAIADFGRRAMTVVADVTTADGADALVRVAVEEMGRLDILVNVVGGMREHGVPVWELSERAWDFTIGLSLKSTFLCTRAALRHMVSKGSGRIVNISSISAAGSPEHAQYAAAKAGVIALTRSCALQTAKFGINVNVVSPGVTMTPSVVSAGIVDPDTDWSATIPLGRPNDPMDVAETVLFLVSPASRNMTGAHLTVAGGLNPLG
jgi:NAD(P)-dependent dehydrogenase (short-subunit alcohol dehydrogenase family)